MARRAARIGPLVTALSALSLALALPALAQGSDVVRGKRVDRSALRGAPMAPNMEREGAEFGALGPSEFTTEERRMVLEAVAPPVPAREAVSVEDRLESPNFESGKAVLLPVAKTRLDDLADRLRGKTKLRFEVVGHTDNQRISRALRMVYPDNQALSDARALAVAEYLRAQLGLPAEAFAAHGMADTVPVAPNDTPQGMAANRRTVIRIWYEQTAAVAAQPAPEPRAVETLVTPDNCAPEGPNGALPFSISIDGHPLDADSHLTEADRQRCVDVALDQAYIQVKYDPLNVAPALNVWAVPGAVARGRTLTWRTYSNYVWFLKKAEVRVFARGQQTTEKPYAVVPVAIGGEATWRPPADASAELGYVLRVYDEQGHFDETAIKAVSLLDRADPASDADRAQRDALSGYGQSSLKVRNIPAVGGSVTISGDHIKPGERVAALGMTVPVDDRGRFVTRQIMPAGPHRVEVAVTDVAGHTATFRRNLSIADKDWFYIAVADLTAGSGRTTGPAPIVTGDTTRYDKKTFVEGRAAFYLKGKILGKYLLTASADTQEQPLKDLFSNFASKDPNYLLRRIDPNRYYPVYGDDSTTVDDAPTQGKLYVRLERGASSIMWGNFQTQWTGTELTQYSRGLYGGNAIWNSTAATGQGERRTTINVFAAEPGTLQSREEFRSTGGSLYYLHRQNLTEGSERLWVEVRDKDSGIVLQRSALASSQDYDIDYLQGRLTLRKPLALAADSSALVQTATLNGNPIYLVASYEFVPGLTAVKGSTVGVRATQWLTDHLRLGGTFYSQGDGGVDQKLGGVDGLIRYRPGTWISGEAARSKGVGVEALTSLTGGFDFTQNRQGSTQSANAFKLDGAMDLSDLGVGLKGRLTAYWQNRDKGFSGPGLITPNGEGLRQAGFAAVLPIGDRAEVAVKIDERHALSQSADSEEAALRLKLTPQWGVSIGLRRDDRDSPAATTAGLVSNASPILSRHGERTDAVVRLDYRPLKAGQSATDGAVEALPGSAMAATPSGGGMATQDSSGPADSILPSAIGSTPGVVAPVNDPTLAAGVAAARIAGLEYEPWNAYAFVQNTLSRGGNRPENNRAGLGAGWQVNSRLLLGAEVSGGSGGVGGKVSGDFALDDRSSLYLSYARETEVPDQNYAGRQGLLTAGGRMRLSEQLGVFAESRAASGEGPHSLTNGFGVDFAPGKAWTTGIRFDTGRLSDPLAGDLRRYAVSLNLGYKNRDLKAASAIEFRDDRSTSLGAVAGTCSTGDLTVPASCVSTAGADKRQTLLFKSSVSYQAALAWRLLGTLNLSRSTSSQGAFYDGDYTEAVLGAAYRPVDNDRWNTLFKYTYFYNLPSSGQVGGATNALLDYTQRSHVFNIDTIYDLRPWLSVGVKYGLRVGDLRDSRATGSWYSSRAQLLILRGDLHFVREWDALVELRSLKVDQAKDVRSGILLGIYRHIGDHAKIGVGYNFTDFSDDLTDLSYRSRGVFVNAITTF